jgi:hypothetical protein
MVVGTVGADEKGESNPHLHISHVVESSLADVVAGPDGEATFPFWVYNAKKGDRYSNTVINPFAHGEKWEGRWNYAFAENYKP